MNLDLLHQVLSQKSLPSIPQVALEVVRLCGGDDAPLGKIGDTVARDPSLAARLLRMANSPVFGTPRRVGSVPHAVTLLGLRTVKVVTISSALVDGIEQGRVPGFPYVRFWWDAVVSGLASRHLAHQAAIPNPDEVFVAGLLQDLGVHALATALGAEYLVLLETARGGEEDLGTLERERLDLHHGEVSAALLRAWEFPDLLAEAVRRHVGGPLTVPASDQADTLAGCLFTAEMVRRLFRAPSSALIEEYGRRAGRVLGLGPQAAQHVLQAVREQLSDTAESLRLNLEGEGMPNGPTPEETAALRQMAAAR
jgi:HD-like signal output (HDOD) protein